VSRRPQVIRISKLILVLGTVLLSTTTACQTQPLGETLATFARDFALQVLAAAVT
jgi:hypothetical protein